MPGQRSGPGSASRAAHEAVAAASPEILPPASAHLFGVGASVADRQALTRRGLASLAEAMPSMWAQIGRRAILQAVYEALPVYWLARADRLEQVGTPWADQAAVNCRRHAWLLSQGLPEAEAAELDEALAVIVGEVA